MDKVKVLYINGGIMNRGGIESFMMNYFRHIDRNRVQIDFVVHGYEQGAYDDEIERLGGKIFRVPIKSRHPFRYKRELRKIFATGEYAIVHSHADAMSAWILKIAKQCGIPVRIAHSHNTDHLTTNRLKYYLNEMARQDICNQANVCFACSEAAGRWLFGEHKFTVIPNAIDLEKFKYDLETRKSIRMELGLSENQLVFGHVGRFDTQKNHEFLIGIFKHLYRDNDNCRLMLVGEGWKQEDIKKLVRYEGLEDGVLFLGMRSDVARLYNAMDCFVLPSLFEGLGIVLLEAQANGLPCFVSDTIPKAVSITDKIKFLPLKENVWIDTMSAFASDEIVSYDIKRNSSTLEQIQLAGYDIQLAAKHLENTYITLKKDMTT